MPQLPQLMKKVNHHTMRSGQNDGRLYYTSKEVDMLLVTRCMAKGVTTSKKLLVTSCIASRAPNQRAQYLLTPNPPLSALVSTGVAEDIYIYTVFRIGSAFL